jgi:hypothetical protein
VQHGIENEGIVGAGGKSEREAHVGVSCVVSGVWG